MVMVADYLVESMDGRRFDLVESTYEPNLASVSKLGELAEILTKRKLQKSYLATYLAQIASSGSVGKDILLEKGSAMAQELEIFRDGVETQQDMHDRLDRYSMTFFLDASTVLDREGYLVSVNPFKIPSPRNGRLVYPEQLEPGSRAHFVAEWELGGAKGITHWIHQAAVLRNADGKPEMNSDAMYVTYGSMDNRQHFVPFYTYLNDSAM